MDAQQASILIPSEAMNHPSVSALSPQVSSLQRGAFGTRLTAALSLCLHAGLLALLMRVTALPGVLDLPAHMGVEIIPISPPQPVVEEAQTADPPAPTPMPPPIPSPPRPISHAKPHVMAPLAPPSQSSESHESDAAAAVVPTPPASPSGSGAAADDALALYAQAVWTRIAAHKPRGVRLPGTATVTFTIAPDGGLLSAALSTSNGSAILNEVALETLRAAAPFPLPPPGANAAQLTFSIPFHFR